MKKVVLTMMAVLLSVAMMAQTCPMNKSGLNALTAKGGAKDANPTWSTIHTPFSTTDINGDAVNVADTLAAGKYIVIDYSATWCNPCYRFHQSKNLEAIHNQLGSQVCVLWVEADASTTIDDIYGTGSNTQGNWTEYSDGSSVSYRIIDCASCESMIDPTGYVPAVYFITPSGYYCHIYGETWGLSISQSNADAVSNIQALIANSPAANQAPIVSLDGPTVGFLGDTKTYTANIISVDSLTSVVWNVTGGTVVNSDNTTAQITWDSVGTQTVTVVATNTTGSDSATINVTVRDGWTWGDEMSYSENNEYVSSIGAGGNITWGVMFPAQYMGGRNYLSQVKMYVSYAGTYTVDIYQGGESNPQTLLRSQTFTANTTEQYVTVDILGGVQLDTTQSLWVVLTNDNVSYPAAGCAYVGDPNGSLVYYNNVWSPVYELNSSLEYTWMIKAVTSATAPAFDFAIEGPTAGMSNTELTYSIAGPTANYSWTFENGTPASATGMTASSTWTEGGNFTITVTGESNGNTASHTLQVAITSCDDNSLPFNEGFENGLGCWMTIDADGDGYNWMTADQMGFTPTAHSGSGVMCSPSWIGGTVLNSDNWLISPAITIPSEGAVLEWWAWGQDASDYAEHYQVRTSTSGSSVADFTGMEYEGDVAAPKTWEKHQRSLNAFAGQNVRIAFRHLCSNMFWLFIDDVKITAGGTSGIDELNTANIDFYPVPVESKLYISEEVREVSVVDVNGRVVVSDKNTRVIDMSDLANGVYFVRAITDNGVATKKIVKK